MTVLQRLMRIPGKDTKGESKCMANSPKSKDGLKRAIYLILIFGGFAILLQFCAERAGSGGLGRLPCFVRSGAALAD